MDWLAVLLVALVVVVIWRGPNEVIEAYGDASGWAMANPVGTGPYRLAQWRRGQKIVLEANPNFREEYFPENGEPAATAS